MLVLAATASATTPVVALVACNGTTDDNQDKQSPSQTNDTSASSDVAAAVSKQLDDLQKQLVDLKTALVDKQNNISANNAVVVKSKEEINALKEQISDLQAKMSDLTKTPVAPKVTLEEKTKDFQVFMAQNYTQLTKMGFDELKKDIDPELPWQRGIGTFSLTQAASYVYNLALQLGYKKDISKIYDLAQIEKSEFGAEVDKTRTAAYEYVKKMFDDIKPASSENLTLALNAPLYKGYSYLYSFGNKMSSRTFTNAGLDISSFGTIVKGKAIDLYTEQADQIKVFPNFSFDNNGDSIDLLPQLNGMQYIDGEKPGSTITQIYVPETTESIKDAKGDWVETPLTPAFTKEIEVDNSFQTYEPSPSEDADQNLLILEGLLKKMGIIFDDENDDFVINLRKNAAKNNISQELLNSFSYLGKHFNAEGGFTMKDVESAYSKLNNGSHYFKAVEVFARGISGLPFASLNAPTQASSVDGDSFDGIIGMSNDHLEGQLLQWGKVTTPGAYKFGTGTYAYADPINYKPTTK